MIVTVKSGHNVVSVIQVRHITIIDICEKGKDSNLTIHFVGSGQLFKSFDSEEEMKNWVEPIAAAMQKLP